jgi:hypothetical protein
MVARMVRDHEVVGSNPVTPTIKFGYKRYYVSFIADFLFDRDDCRRLKGKAKILQYSALRVFYRVCPQTRQRIDNGPLL